MRDVLTQRVDAGEQFDHGVHRVDAVERVTSRMSRFAEELEIERRDGEVGSIRIVPGNSGPISGVMDHERCVDIVEDACIGELNLASACLFRRSSDHLEDTVDVTHHPL